MELRRVRTDGSIKWAGKMLFVGEALEGEVVGLRQVTDDAWSMHLGPLALATLHERSRVLMPIAPEEVSPMCPVKSVTHVPGCKGYGAVDGAKRILSMLFLCQPEAHGNSHAQGIMPLRRMAPC
jgi:hypothetical protein